MYFINDENKSISFHALLLKCRLLTVLPLLALNIYFYTTPIFFIFLQISTDEGNVQENLYLPFVVLSVCQYILLNSNSKIDGYLAHPDFLGATFLCFVQYSIGSDGNLVSKSLTSCSSSIPEKKKKKKKYKLKL